MVVNGMLGHNRLKCIGIKFCAYLQLSVAPVLLVHVFFLGLSSTALKLLIPRLSPKITLVGFPYITFDSFCRQGGPEVQGPSPGV